MHAHFSVLPVKTFLRPQLSVNISSLEQHTIELAPNKRKSAFFCAGPDSSVRYAVGGFSQGGSLALHTATSLTFQKYLDGKPAPDVPLAAAVCISGWLSGSECAHDALDFCSIAGLGLAFPPFFISLKLFCSLFLSRQFNSLPGCSEGKRRSGCKEQPVYHISCSFFIIEANRYRFLVLASL